MAAFDLEVECPHCGAAFAVPRIRMGRREACPVCGGAVTVPAEGHVAPVVGAGPRAAPAEGVAADEAGGEPAESAEVVEQEQATAPVAAAWDEAGPVVVCCAHEGRPNPVAVGAILAELVGLRKMDARRQVVTGRGLLADGVHPQLADRLMAALRSAGVETFAVPVALLPAVEERPGARAYDADANALVLQAEREEAFERVPWAQVVAGLALRMPQRGEENVRIRYEGDYVSTGGMADVWVNRPLVERREPATSPVQVRLLLRHGPERVQALVLDERRVRFAYLGERVRPTREENLPLFLTDVLTRAPRAFFTEGYGVAAGGGLPDLVPRVTGKLELANYMRWALCCATAIAQGWLAAPSR